MKGNKALIAGLTVLLVMGGIMTSPSVPMPFPSSHSINMVGKSLDLSNLGSSALGKVHASENGVIVIPATIGDDDDIIKNEADDSSDSSQEEESKKDNDDDRDDDRDSSKTTKDEREEAIARLDRYRDNILLVNGEDLTEEQKKKLRELCNSGRNAIDDGGLRQNQLSDIESDTKKNMDDYVAACLKKIPNTTVEYLAVGNVYDIPIASHGQVMNLVLPILNLGTEDLTNVIVSPVVSGNVREFPFQISRGGFTQEIPWLPGSHSMEQAMAQRAELMWAFALRDDVLDGYYKIEFDVVYHRNGAAESAKLSTFVRCIGAPGAASVEDGDGGKTSTPRIIVTGFSTEPKDVYAGSTFLLQIDVKNVSKRTAVSNIQFDLKAAEEGKDSDSTYYSFLPTSGSNTIYVESLPANAQTRLEIEMTAKADLVQKPYAIDMSMKYEDDDYNPYEFNTAISVPVKQHSKVEYSTPEVVPDILSVGGQSNVMFSIFNTGKTILYNVKVSFDDPAVSGGDAYVGKLESGSTGNVDVMVTGESPGGHEGGVKGVISYENDAGDVTEVDFTIPLVVEEAEIPADDFAGGDMGMDMPMDPESTAPPIKIIVAAVVVIITLAIVVIVIIRKRKKKRDEIDIG